MKHISIIILFSAIASLSKAQVLPNEFTVIFDPVCLQEHFPGDQDGLHIYMEPCYPGSDIYKVAFHGIDKQAQLNWLSTHPCILFYRPAQILKARTGQPNDPSFPRQYALKNMFIPDIWDFKCEGIGGAGDTLAIGIVDYGFNFAFEDIAPNLFINYAEIPDNRKDDDSNGFVDDYLGFNADGGSGDDHPNSDHGTQVASVIGAVGNNKVGITGVNQHIKMILCSADTDFELVRCYYYFTKMRRLYNESNGKKGAFIVSSSCSLGFDGQFPEDFPHICEVYDSLGSVGILNSVATVNENWDIQERGDVPGLCNSDYTLVVTNLDKNNNKVLSSGYNKKFVDIAANGEKILMYNSEGKLVEDNGTSFATPHVAGTVSLLYQFCPKLSILAKAKPDSAVLFMKNLLMTCGTERAQLKNLILSGSQLNAGRALSCLKNWCEGVVGTVDLLPKPNPTSNWIDLNLSTLRFGTYKVFIYNALGQNLSEQEFLYSPNDGSQFKIELGEWPPSLYFLTLEGLNFKKTFQLIKI